MTRSLCKAVLLMICIGAVLIGCGAEKSRQEFDPAKLESFNGDRPPASGEALSDAAVREAAEESAAGYEVGETPERLPIEDIRSDVATVGLDEYMGIVENFLVILDASGSKFLPYNGQIKLKIAKDIARRFNDRVPARPLTGGLRRYGFEAGAFTEKTEIIYGMSPYNRSAYRSAIETIRWAGGKSPLALAIDQATNDLTGVAGDIAVVIISDGKIYQGDPLDSARRMKDTYGDRLCIYTALVGDLPFGKQLLYQIAKIGECGYMVTADQLVPDSAMDQWVDDIFNRRRGFGPTDWDVDVRVDRAGPCLDSDGDGVCDDQDACPGTPRGARVDARGCWDIGRVQFVIDRYNVRPQYYSVIDEVIRVMKLNPGLKIRIQGHTCTIASEKYNMKLSYNRAIAVSDYMIKRGISSERIAVEGFGFHRPTASNQTEEGRSLNRRAEFEPVR